MDQELSILHKHLSSPPVFSGVRGARSLVVHGMFYESFFVLFLLAIVLSFLLHFLASDYSLVSSNISWY